MTEIRFYHLTRSPLETVLPRLIGKVLEQTRKAVILAGSDERAEQLSMLLWTSSRDSFLPHGSKADGFPERQPVWLSGEDENPNGADIAFLVDGAKTANPGAYSLCCTLFDGRNGDIVEGARKDWKTWREAGFHLTYWQQDEQGAWSMRNETGKPADKSE